MKKAVRIFVVIFLIAGFATANYAQVSTATTTAGANILAPITLTQKSPLHMGTMSVLPGTGGTCTLSTDNVRTTGGGGGVVLSSMAPTSTNATYRVKGEPLYDYTITLPPFISVSDGSPVNDMIINALKAKCLSGATEGLTGTLIAVDGADEFKIGGTLNVAAGQAPGAYTGTFDVIVNYN